jgi:hypothetical protein
MAAVGWAAAVVVVVVLTCIGVAPTTSTALQLVMASPDMVVVRDVGLHWVPWVGLGAMELLSCNEAGYGVQSMGRLRSDFEEFCEALEDMGELESVDGSSLP